jgi:glucokinase
LANESAYLEASFKNDDLAVARDLAKDCFAYLREVQVTLQEAFAAAVEEQPDSGPGVDHELSASEQEQLKELLQTLVVYLNDFDAEAVAFVSAKQAEFASLLPKETLEELKNNLSRFEFEEATEIVNRILGG